MNFKEAVQTIEDYCWYITYEEADALELCTYCHNERKEGHKSECPISIIRLLGVKHVEEG